MDLIMQATWLTEDRWISGASEDPRVDRVDADHLISSKHMPNKRSYNGQIRGDVAASHALMEWTHGPHIADQTRAH